MDSSNKKLFPQRLWELIHDQKYNFCLRWSQDGQRVYLNRHEFETNYLKTAHNQFHTQKAISFVRQMNMYGFRKVDDCYYENDNFKRNCPHLLKNMVRRHSNKNLFAFATSQSANHQNATTQSVHHISQQQQQHLQRHHQQHLLDRQQQQQQQVDRQQLQPQFYNNPIQSSRNSPSNSSMTQSSDEGSAHQLHHFNTGQVQQQQQQANTRSPTPTQAAAVAAAAAATLGNIQQCFVEDAASSLNQISTALAVINSHGVNQQTAPLASTLYHRLAALNFANPQQASLAEQLTNQQHSQQQQQQQQQVRSLAAAMSAAESSTASLEASAVGSGAAGRRVSTAGETRQATVGSGTSGFHNGRSSVSQFNLLQQTDHVVPQNRVSSQRPPITNNNNQQHQQQHHHQQQQQQLQHQQLLLLQQQQQQQQPHFNIFDTPMDTQQSLAARQALQQTLIRYILQLKQPQNSRQE